MGKDRTPAPLSALKVSKRRRDNSTGSVKRLPPSPLVLLRRKRVGRACDPRAPPFLPWRNRFEILRGLLRHTQAGRWTAGVHLGRRRRLVAYRWDWLSLMVHERNRLMQATA
jgi:hypothetical protein